jgi:hypothetical protein
MVLVIFLVSGACGPRRVPTSESNGVAGVSPRVLIASQQTRFKNAVVAEIREHLRQRSISLKIIDVRGLQYESADDYQSIVILNACMAGRPDPRVETFVDFIAGKEKVVLLTTGALGSWRPPSESVDAMTAASNMNDFSQLAREIIGKLNRRLKPVGN